MTSFNPSGAQEARWPRPAPRVSFSSSLKPQVLSLLVLACLLVLASISAAQSSTTLRYEETRAAMGSSFTIVAFGPDEARLESAVNEAFEEIARLDRRWSHYIEASDLSMVNREAAEEPVKLDPELFRMLETCLRFSRETDGAFDITVGPLLKRWGFFRGTGRLPAPEEIAEALSKVGWRKVVLDRREQTVGFTQAGVELDLGGIGKGYAVDRAAQILKEGGVTTALLLSGTSSILAVGAPAGEPGFSIRIRHPKEKDKSVADVALKDASLSTSGNYEKFFQADGKTYSHIFDPRTGYPAEGVLSVTAIAPTGTAADALSTAFFVMGRDKTLEYVRKHRDVRALFCTEKGCEWLPSPPGN